MIELLNTANESRMIAIKNQSTKIQEDVEYAVKNGKNFIKCFGYMFDENKEKLQAKGYRVSINVEMKGYYSKDKTLGFQIYW